MRIRWTTALWLATIFAGQGANYHVNALQGDDQQDGRSTKTAWRTLKRVNTHQLQPGDVVNFHAGGIWNGQLVIAAQGTSKRPIIFQAFGKGPRPRIDAAGVYADALVVSNAQHVEVRDFEVTNTGQGEATRRGVNIIANNCGTLTNILIRNLFIHDVNGTQRRKNNGGIIFHTEGARVPSRFDGLRLENNIIWQVDRSGIAAQSYHAMRHRWYPSTNVVIRNNWLGNLGGDGIVPWATDGCLVEHNIVEGANERSDTYNAGIWPWSTDNTVMRLNRASKVKTLMDGQGFDSDYNSRNTILEYNLSHDNEGGFLLVCSPGQRNPRENWGNQGTIARYNISRNDRARTFHVSAAENTVIHNNAIYIGRGLDVQLMLLTDWSGWTKGLEVRDNLFVSEGVARYGYQTSRAANGSYGIDPGWGPAREVVFRGNRYVGQHENRPSEAGPVSLSAPQPITMDWPGPQFDPRQPEEFPAYIKAHRQWMERLMRAQFGAAAKF